MAGLRLDDIGFIFTLGFDLVAKFVTSEGVRVSGVIGKSGKAGVGNNCVGGDDMGDVDACVEWVIF